MMNDNYVATSINFYHSVYATPKCVLLDETWRCIFI